MLLGSFNPHNKNVTIIGAGIAGLLATYRLLKAGYKVTLYEKENRAGGLIQTLQTPHGIAETAVHSVPGTKAVRQLFEDLNIEIAECARKAKSGLIWRNGKMRKWPLTFSETIKMLLRAATRKADGMPKNLSDWARYHVGCNAVHNLLAPMTTGIYGTTPDRLEMPIAFPTMNIVKGKTLLTHLWQRRKNKRPPPIAPKRGMQELTDKLFEFVRAHPDASIYAHMSQTTLVDGNVIVCTPADAAAEILENKFPDLATALRKIEYSPLVTATVFVRRDEVQELKSAFGVLFPPAEKNSILGILFNSVCFVNRTKECANVPTPSPSPSPSRYRSGGEGQTELESNAELHSFTFMLGGTVQPAMMQKSDEDIQAITQNGLHDYLGWKGGFFHCIVTRWPKAVPLYDFAVRELQEQAAKDLRKPGIALFGNYTGGVALRSMIETNIAEFII